MELRMRPATEGRQRCLQFEVDIGPRARVFAYRDFLDNWVHHFDMPRRHSELLVTARAQVQIDAPGALPAVLDPATWAVIDGWQADGVHWDFRQPSRFATWSPALLAFVDALGPAGRRGIDPLTTAREIMAAIHHGFEYVPNATRVDSPIDEALGRAPRRLPGLQPRDDCGVAAAGPALSLRQRLHRPAARR